MTAGATAGVIALVALFAAAPAIAASTEAPADLDPGYVSDLSGVLSDTEEARLEEQLGELASGEGLPELYVVLVPDFEGPDNALAWADATALRNNLASDQYLLAIATDGRTLAISAEYGGGDTTAGPLSESRVLEIENALGSDYLAHDDWAGGIEYVADEFSYVPWPWWVWVLGLVVLALIVFLVVQLVLLVRRRAARAAELRTLEGQKKRAATLLVQTDEAVRTSEQELGFVTAEFGEETTVEFAAVLTECRAHLQEAFQLLERLQDAEEDTAQETRAWTRSIIDLCGKVDAALEGRKRELTSLRALAAGASETLARLRSARAEAQTLQAEASSQLESLASIFSPADLAAVSDNAEEIGGRLRAADAELEALDKAAAARRPKEITRSIHEIERLLAEAKDLRRAVDAQAEALAARSTAPGDTAVVPVLERAKAAVRAAETSVQARAGTVSAFPLTRLHFAQQQLAAAAAATDSAEGGRLAAAALAAAEQVQSLIGAPLASERSRFVRSSASAADSAVMHDPPGTSGSSPWQRSYAYEDESDGTGAKAIWGGVGGGAVGFFSSLGISDGDGGVIILFVLGGIVLGALSGAFGGGNGGGSSSGWGGSSRSSSWSGGSSRSSSSRSSGSSGGSRSSGRSGGRRF